jgi:hypothetical protein
MAGVVGWGSWGKRLDFVFVEADFAGMLTAEEQLTTAVLDLPLGKRAELADLLMQSLVSKGDAEVAAAWNVEAESRARAFERGELKAVSVEKAFGFKL